MTLYILILYTLCKNVKIKVNIKIYQNKKGEK